MLFFKEMVPVNHAQHAKNSIHQKLLALNHHAIQDLLLNSMELAWNAQIILLHNLLTVIHAVQHANHAIQRLEKSY